MSSQQIKVMQDKPSEHLLELLLKNTGLARAGICGHPMTERERQGVHTWATLEEACGLTSSSFWLRSSTSHGAADFAAAAPRPACRSGTDTTRSAWQVTCAWAQAERQCTPHEASVRMIQMPGKAFDDASWCGGVRGNTDAKKEARWSQLRQECVEGQGAGCVTSTVSGPEPLCSCCPCCVPAASDAATCCSDASKTGTCGSPGGARSITLSLGHRSASWARIGLFADQT